MDNELSKWSVQELRAELKLHKLSTTGKKSQLISRLVEHLESNTELQEQFW